MADFRTRARTILAKIESTSGTDASPTVGADAVKMINPASSNALEVLETNEVTRAIDRVARITGGGPGGFSGGVYLKGSGSAGTAPEFGPLLRACAMSETLLAADDTGTAQAGATGSITLAAATVSTDNEFRGMIIETTGGTGSGQIRVITGTTASSQVATVYPDWSVTPDATTTYAIRACAVYQPASSSLETATLYEYIHKVGAGNHLLRKRLGMAGTWSLSAQTRQIGQLDFTFSGQLQSDADVSDPGAATYDDVTARPIMSANSYLGGVAVKQRLLSLDYGGQVAVPDDPSNAYGIDAASVVDRRISGRINPPRANVATRDVLADLIAGTEKALWLQWGATAGSRVSIYCPAIRFTGAEDEDIDGFMADGIPFDAGGIDTGVFLTFF